MTKANIKIAPSSVINYGGVDCIVLDVWQDKILVLAKESIGNMPFDEGNSNNFPKGTLASTSTVNSLRSSKPTVQTLRHSSLRPST